MKELSKKNQLYFFVSENSLMKSLLNSLEIFLNEFRKYLYIHDLNKTIEYEIAQNENQEIVLGQARSRRGSNVYADQQSPAKAGGFSLFTNNIKITQNDSGDCKSPARKSVLGITKSILVTGNETSNRNITPNKTLDVTNPAGSFTTTNRRKSVRNSIMEGPDTTKHDSNSIRQIGSSLFKGVLSPKQHDDHLKSIRSIAGVTPGTTNELIKIRCHGICMFVLVQGIMSMIHECKKNDIIIYMMSLIKSYIAMEEIAPEKFANGFLTILQDCVKLKKNILPEYNYDLIKGKWSLWKDFKWFIYPEISNGYNSTTFKKDELLRFDSKSDVFKSIELITDKRVNPMVGINGSEIVINSQVNRTIYLLDHFIAYQKNIM